MAKENLLVRALRVVLNVKPQDDLPLKESPDTSDKVVGITPGRVSEPDMEHSIIGMLKGEYSWVEPSFNRELIPLFRSLYKGNSEVSIAVQDMYKLANTGHKVTFPYNTDEESLAMRKHLLSVSKKWAGYTSGIDGLVNKMIIQCMVSGAISIESVPNIKLNGISTLIFVKPESILFSRGNDGVYLPYQIRKNYLTPNNSLYIKLNPQTYNYTSMYNDTDEPYGIPPLMPALESLKTQSDMKANIASIMDLVGLIGFLEVKMAKPSRKPSESDAAYTSRLNSLLRTTKSNIREGLKDGVVAGYIDDHEFKMNSTTSRSNGTDKLWNINQQSVANGLGVNGTLIGVNGTTSEGAAGIILSKMISQLRNLQMVVANVLEFIYNLELLLAGFNNKGLVVTFSPSTISDDLKVQQGMEYKIRNLTSLYNQGIISQEDFAFEVGVVSPDKKEPRVSPDKTEGVSDPATSAKKKKRIDDKGKSATKVRDKVKVVPKRKDQKK